jgi:outer membrane protein assembly factor BamB
MKHITGFFYIAFSFILAIGLFSSCKKTAEWPAFRGSHSNLMIAEGKNIPENWSNDSNIAWTYDIEGEGWSSPVIWGDRVFVLSVVPESVAERPEEPRPQPPASGQNPPAGGQNPPPPPQGEDTLFKQDLYRWEVICIDMNTGKEIWKQVALKGNPRVNKHRMSNYASETPVTDGERVYAWFGMHGLYCYDMDGNLLWQKDLGKFKTLNEWGTGSSPVLYNKTLYIQMDNEEQSFITALDAVTGDEKWRTAREEKTNYSTPVIWENNVRTELVAGGKTARGYDINTGENIWQLKIAGDMNIPSATYDKERIYIGNAGRMIPASYFAVKAGAEGDITPIDSASTSSGVLWTVSDAGQGNPSPLLYKGYIYIISSRAGEFTCLHAIDGKQVYKQKIEGVGAVWSSPWAFNDKIFFCDEKGITQVLKAGAQFELLDSNNLDDKFWASVAISDNTIIIRGAERLYCVKL